MSYLDVVVPTYNRLARLKLLLSGLEQEWAGGARFGAIIVVDGATDGTLDFLRGVRTAFPLQIVDQVNSGPAAARNRGLAASVAEIVLFLDDDVVPGPGLIARHRSWHERERSAIVIGPMLVPPGRRIAPWLEWEAAMLQKQYRAMLEGRYRPTPRQFYTANASVRRGLALEAGGFDERLRRAEDVELAYRLRECGGTFYFDPDAVVYHNPDRSFESWLNVAYQYGCVAVFMAECCNRPDDLFDAVRGWDDRHPLNRMLPRLCVGYPRRQRAVRATFERLIRLRHPGLPDRVRRALCSALVNVQYWQGIADATGLGRHTWDKLADPLTLLSGRAGPSRTPTAGRP